MRYKMWENSSLGKPHFLPVQESVILMRDRLSSRIPNIMWYRQALERLVHQHSHLSTSSRIGGLVKRLDTLTKGRQRGKRAI